MLIPLAFFHWFSKSIVCFSTLQKTLISFISTSVEGWVIYKAVTSSRGTRSSFVFYLINFLYSHQNKLVSQLLYFPYKEVCLIMFSAFAKTWQPSWLFNEHNGSWIWTFTEWIHEQRNQLTFKKGAEFIWSVSSFTGFRVTQVRGSRPFDFYLSKELRANIKHR